MTNKHIIRSHNCTQGNKPSESEALSEFTPVLSCFHIGRYRLPFEAHFGWQNSMFSDALLPFLRFSGVVNFTRAALQPLNLSPAVWRYCGSEKGLFASGPNLYFPYIGAVEAIMFFLNYMLGRPLFFFLAYFIPLLHNECSSQMPG